MKSKSKISQKVNVKITLPVGIVKKKRRQRRSSLKRPGYAKFGTPVLPQGGTVQPSSGGPNPWQQQFERVRDRIPNAGGNSIGGGEEGKIVKTLSDLFKEEINRIKTDPQSDLSNKFGTPSFAADSAAAAADYNPSTPFRRSFSSRLDPSELRGSTPRPKVDYQGSARKSREAIEEVQRQIDDLLKPVIPPETGSFGGFEESKSSDLFGFGSVVGGGAAATEGMEQAAEAFMTPPISHPSESMTMVPGADGPPAANLEPLEGRPQRERKAPQRLTYK